MYLRCPDNLNMEVTGHFLTPDICTYYSSSLFALACIPQQDVATYNMYPYLEGGFPLPFDRPSKSNCEAVLTACGYTGQVSYRGRHLGYNTKCKYKIENRF